MSKVRKTLLMEKHLCPLRLAYTFDNPLRKLFHKPEKIFKNYLNEGDTAIDIGCGMGYFSIGMAKIVGESGAVISVDIQQEMLDVLMKRAGKKSLAHIIHPHLSEPNNIGVDIKGNFILAFWMIHETPDAKHLLKQISLLLKPGGKFLLVEPRIYVSVAMYEEVLQKAEELGLKLIERPQIKISRAALFISP